MKDDENKYTMKDDDLITYGAIAEILGVKIEGDPKLAIACIKLSEFHQLKEVVDQQLDARQRFLAKEYIMTRLIEKAAGQPQTKETKS